MRISGKCLLRVLCLLMCCCRVTGEQYIPPHLRNVTQCAHNASSCPNNAYCNANQWGHFCVCNNGFYNNKNSSKVTFPGGLCEDLSKFKCKASSECPSNSTCRGLKCICNSGFQAVQGGQYVELKGHCEDIDECSYYSSPCIPPATCNNTQGSFSCNCPVGFTLSNTTGRDMHLTTCADINECAHSPSPCIPPTFCNNTQGSYVCNCPVGYTLSNITGEDLNLTTCTDINECAHSPSPCIPPAFCNNSQGSYVCNCPVGYTLSNITRGDLNLTTCTDINECAHSPSPCIPPAFCNNTPGSHICNCPVGYTLSNTTRGELNVTTCTDINECTHSLPLCIPPAFCNNIQGSHVCNCPVGYTLSNITRGNMNLTTCTDIDECAYLPSPCIPPAFCINTQGSFFCNCPAGFTLSNVTRGDMNLTTCTDINECAHSLSPCIPPAFCNNTQGSHACNCPVGYTLSNITRGDLNVSTCTEIEVNCESFIHEKKELEKCPTQDQSPYCSLLHNLSHIRNSSCQGNETSSLKNITNVFSQILNNSASWSNLSSPQLSVTVTNLLYSVESMALASFAHHPRNDRASNDVIEIETKVSEGTCNGKNNSIQLNVKGNNMVVSCFLVPKPTDGAIFILYKNLESHFTPSTLQGEGTIDQNRAKVINSQIVTGAITIQEKENLSHPVQFYLQHLTEPDPSIISLCVYWDASLAGWSSRGCKTIISNATHTICSCSHLSSFAIITAHSAIKEDAGVILLSRIGLSISLLCLCLSLITFLLCRSLKSAHTSILTVLCGCLFLGQLLILVGLQQTSMKILCSVIAGSLHFLLLCAFCWMSLESILLFLTVRNLRAVNYMTSQRSHFPYMCLVGFGVPVIIVTISAAIRSDGYGTEKHCWLSLSLVWSFLGPVCVFIIVNTILLILTIWLLWIRIASLNTNVSTLKDTRLLTFKALAQLFILGSTWIFGFFQFGQWAIVFSYLFTIFNSLQGAFIFLVHCLLNRKVREEYRKAFYRIHQYKSESDVVSGSTIAMKIKSIEASGESKAEEHSTTLQWS